MQKKINQASYPPRRPSRTSKHWPRWSNLISGSIAGFLDDYVYTIEGQWHVVRVIQILNNMCLGGHCVWRLTKIFEAIQLARIQLERTLVNIVRRRDLKRRLNRLFCYRSRVCCWGELELQVGRSCLPCRFADMGPTSWLVDCVKYTKSPRLVDYVKYTNSPSH